MINPVTPDWPGLLANLRREGTPARVYYFEHGVAENVQVEIADRYKLWDGLDAANPENALERSLVVHRFLGHELVRIFPPGGRIVAPKRDGAWAEEGRGPVTTWDEFEQFDWPRPADADLSCMDRFEALAPENQRAFHVLDIWEVVRELMGFEQLCFALYEAPDLVEAVFARVGEFAVSVAGALCAYEYFGAIYIADDLGHKTGTMIRPDQVRAFVLPWHKRVVELAHGKGKLALLHSCGDMYCLIDDYIDDSDINACIDRARTFFRQVGFPLPPWAEWSPADWAAAGPEYDAVRAVRLGWDVTDFGSGDLAHVGRTIFTLRNGRHSDPDHPKSYAEKAMCLFPQQKSVIHCHRHKREDIICRAEGVVAIELWRAAPDQTLDPESLTVSVDGRAVTLNAGQVLRLEPGMSVCVPPMVYHRFWGEGGGPVLSMEVSSVCDDLSDNLFLHEGDRFPAIDEDEPRRWVLCSEYPSIR